MKVLLILKPDSRYGKQYYTALLDLHNALYADQRAKLNDLTGRDGFGGADSLDGIWGPGDVMALAIDENDKAVGFLSFAISGKNAQKWLWIHNFYVDSSQRGKGVGTLLMDTVKEYGKAKGCRFMQLTVLDNNDAALAMYQKMGFQTEMQDMVKEL
ncbi:acetyltransferase [Erwinia phage vB_EamM_Caitlin]|uniref:acetyltransferase n=1 Tax=Erwinia phage vB_EamM_Caitlin TaxID=1883379 RepID=UPI00081D0EFC|nr:acetyltransferase [Erwinia phage vB_EamM_Caitlin]ANZ48398.1 putative GNAT family acetyltransferase [Erwinia phage vB_EamM_Caitlin]